MAIGSILRGLGSKISGSALGRGAASMGQRVASSPLGRGAANLGSAGANYAKLGYGKTINQIVRQFGVDEETAKRILMGIPMGIGGAGILAKGANDWMELERHLDNRINDHGSGIVGKPMELDRFGFGIDARQLTDE